MFRNQRNNRKQDGNEENIIRHPSIVDIELKLEENSLNYKPLPKPMKAVKKRKQKKAENEVDKAEGGEDQAAGDEE
jgi:hypothetical protein